MKPTEFTDDFPPRYPHGYLPFFMIVFKGPGVSLEQVDISHGSQVMERSLPAKRDGPFQ